MRHIFEASYKSFYFTLIGVLWALAVLLAILQSSIVVELVIKNILPKQGVKIESANGGALSGIELKGVRYENLLSASELRCRLDILPLLSGEVSFSYLDIKDLRINEKELDKLLSKKSSTKKPDFLELIKIERLSLSMLDFSYSDLKIPRLKLNADYLYYDFDKFYMDIAADISSNILDAKFHGEILDKNYSVRGSFKSNGSEYINKIVDDTDFDFNAIKETDFVLRGDDAGLYAKAHIKNSGELYKYIVNAKINDAISEINLHFKDWSMRVDTKGEMECKYGVIDSEFSVVYDGNKTTYFGKGKAKKFTHIPLGPFTNSLKIKEAINEEINFFGDVKKVEVTAKNRVNATLLDEKFNVDSSETLVNYDIKKKYLKVATKAKLNTEYFKADVENTAEDGDKFSFSGSVTNFADFALGIDAAALTSATATYGGDEDILSVGVKSKSAAVNISSKGYSIYNFNADLQDIKPLKFTSITLGGKVKGHYDYKKSETAASIKLINSKLFGKELIANELSFIRTPDSIIVPRSKINLGGVDANLEASTANGILNAALKTNGAKLALNGTLNKNIKLTLCGNSALIAEEYAKITDTPKQNITGEFDIEALIKGEPKEKNFSFKGASEQITLGGESIKSILISGDSNKDALTLNALQASYQDKNYRLSKPAIAWIESDRIVCDEIRINDILNGSFIYGEGSLSAKADIKNFAYKDNNKISFTLDAKLAALYKNNKLSIDGDAYLKTLRAGFELKSSRITKDKDIVILKPKKLEFNEQKFEDNLALRINITNTDKAIYRSKEAYAPISLNLLYYKDFGEKPVLLGLIKTDRGYYDMEGKRFLLGESQIVLTQTEPNNPYLDLTLRRADKDTQIFIFVKEFASAPKISFSSKPAMSEKEIISYLLFGVDPDSSFSKSSSDAKYSSKAIAALSNALSRDLTKELGIKLDKIEISPTEVTDANGRTTQTTKVEVGKRVTKDLTVTYKNDIESSVVFEYQINKNVNVESQAGRKSSIDIFYKQDY